MRASAGVPPFSHHMDASEGAVSISSVFRIFLNPPTPHYMSSASVFCSIFSSSSSSSSSLSFLPCVSSVFFARYSMWACAALLIRTDVYGACSLPTLAEWTLPATCTSALCVSPLARAKSVFIIPVCGCLLHYLAQLFSSVFFFVLHHEGGVGQSALCMPCVRPLYAYA